MNQSFKRFRLVEEDEFQQRQKQKQVRDYNPELVSEVRKRSQVQQFLKDPHIEPELKLLFLRQLNHNLRPVTETTKPKSTPKSVSVGFEHKGFKSELPLHLEDEAEAFEDAEEGPDAEGNAAEGEDAAEPGQVVEPEGGAAVAENLGLGEADVPQIETIDLDEIVHQLAQQYRGKAQQVVEILKTRPDLLKVSSTHRLIIENQVVQNSNAIDMFKYLYNAGSRDDAPLGFVKFKRILAILKVPSTLVSNKTVKNDLKDMAQSGFGKRIPKPIAFAKRPIALIPLNSKSRKRTKPLSALNSLNLYKL